MTGRPQYFPGRIDRFNIIDNLDAGTGITEIDGILARAPGREFSNRLTFPPQRRIGKLAFSPAGNEFLHHDIARTDLGTRLGKSGFQRLPVIGADDLRPRNHGVAAAHIRLQDNGECDVERIGIIGGCQRIGPGKTDTEFRSTSVEQRLLTQPLKGCPIGQNDPVKGGKLFAMFRNELHLAISRRHQKATLQMMLRGHFTQERYRPGIART